MQPPDLSPIMARAAGLILREPKLTKSEVAAKIGGRRQWAWAAIERLITDGVVTTQKNDRGRSVCVPASWAGTPSERPEQVFNGQTGNKSGTGIPGPASGRTTSAGLTNNREAPQRTGADKPGGLALVTEPRCRCCRDPDLRDRINRMIAGGFSLRAIYESLAAANASLPSNRRVTMDSLETHRSKHFNVQMGASAVWRTILEERIAADAENYENGVMNLVTPRVLFETVVAKGYAGLVDEGAEVTLDQALSASRELARLAATEDDELKWSRQQAQMNRIVEAFRTLPEPFQQQVLAVAEGRTPVAPTPERQLAVIEGGLAADTEVADPFDDDGEDYDDEDDD